MFKYLFNASHEKQSLGSSFRRKRFKHFKHLVEGLISSGKFSKKITVLDIGGIPSYWDNIQDDLIDKLDITILNLEVSKVKSSYNAIAGDATNLKSIQDKQFDLVYSNSVIEHLYTYENQIKMANEVIRVGDFFYVQTPNKYFIIEPHYILPLFQFLPRNLQYLILTKTKLSRLQKWSSEEAENYIDEIRLLSKTDMRNLFIDSTLFIEKLLFMNKSIIVHNLPQK